MQHSNMNENVQPGYYVTRDTTEPTIMAENNLMSWQGETLEFVSKRIAGILLQTKSVSINSGRHKERAPAHWGLKK